MKPAASEREAIGLMNLLHFMDGASAGRATMELDLRHRRVIQALGLTGPMTIVAVGQRLGVSASTMTGIADRLERDRYLRRKPHPTDRRATVLELTAKGRRLFDQEKAFYQRLIDETLTPLDEDVRATMLRALRDLRPG